MIAQSDQPNPIHRPAHYTQGRIEVLGFIEDQQFGFCAGDVLKYLCRYRYRGSPVEDLQKARVYLDRLIHSQAAGGQNA